MCKLFERILTEDIYDHISRTHLITSAQYGLIKERSTELQLINSYCSCDLINGIDTKCFADTVYNNNGRNGSLLTWLATS